MSNIYIAEKEQLDNQNTLLSTYNSTLQDIEEELSDIATLAEQKQIKTVTPTKQKQIIEADEGYNSLASVIVNPSPPPDMIDKTITQNGIYKAAEEMSPVDGYRQVEVDVPDPVLEHGSATPKTTAETYTPKGDGFSDFTVEATPLENKTITPTTQQQTVTPTVPNIGFSDVTVEAIPYPNPSSIVDGSVTTYTDNSITSIRDYAFYNCTSLTSIRADNVLSIGICAFQSCAYLNSIILPSVTTLPVNAVRNCTALITANFPNVETLSNTVFFGDTRLQRLEFPKATSFGVQCFTNCIALTTVILGKRATLSSATMPTKIVFYVQPDDFEWYQTATNWSDLYGQGKVKSINDLPA